MKYSIVEGPAKQEDLAHVIKGDSALNLHDQTLCVMYCDERFYALFSTGADSFNELNSEASRSVNASFIKPYMTDFNFDQAFKDVLE